MKRILHAVILLLLISFSSSLNAQRYLSEVFSSTTVTSNVVFGWNNSVLRTADDPVGYQPVPGVTLYHDSLRADVYQPVGDALTARPTVIILHTGSFFPIFYNNQCTGIKTDSMVAEMCRRLARRGFTAISMNYRMGWNPQALGPAGQEIRTGTLLQAAGRAIQDAKACVRYFRNNALTSNTYKIDPNRIIIGGTGSGGYIALAYPTVNNYAQISLPKFTATQNNATYGFTAGKTYFDSTLWGTTDGYGGILNNSNNTPGVNNSVSFAFNIGGALADSSWLVQGNVPMVCFHTVHDPDAPYGCAAVTVPVTGDFVIDACGSQYVNEKSCLFNNNAGFQSNNWTDPFTVRAKTMNGGNGFDALFPFDLDTNYVDPWNWVDSVTCYQTMMFGLGFTKGHADTAWYGNLVGNPTMSSAHGHAYVDTIMGYLCPRLFYGLSLGVSEQELLEKTVSIYPNPTAGQFTVTVSNTSDKVMAIDLMDIAGRLTKHVEKPAGNKIVFERSGLDAGMYFVKLRFDKGEVVKKIILQ